MISTDPYLPDFGKIIELPIFGKFINLPDFGKTY
jgi:hypothetical protein